MEGQGLSLLAWSVCSVQGPLLLERALGCRIGNHYHKLEIDIALASPEMTTLSL